MSGYGASLGDEFTHNWYFAGSAAYTHRSAYTQRSKSNIKSDHHFTYLQLPFRPERELLVPSSLSLSSIHSLQLTVTIYL